MEKAQAIVKIESYEGNDTSLDVAIYDKDSLTRKSDSMWIIVHIEGGEVNNDLTDYGYTFKGRSRQNGSKKRRQIRRGHSITPLPFFFIITLNQLNHARFKKEPKEVLDVENKPSREELLEEWQDEHDPLLEDMEGFEEFVADRRGSYQEVAELQNGKEVENTFAILKKVSETGGIKIDDEGVFLRETSDDENALVEMLIPPAALQELHVEGHGTQYEINFGNFMDYFGRARGNEPVRLVRTGERLRIEFPESGREYSVPADVSSEETIPKVDFSEAEDKAEIEMDPGTLKSTILDSKAVGNVATLEMKDSSLTLRTIGKYEKPSYRYGTPSMSSSKSRFEKNFEDIDGHGEAKAAYNLDLLKPLVRKGLGDLTLKWATDYPLTVRYTFFEDLAFLQGIVAPLKPEEVEGLSL